MRRRNRMRRSLPIRWPLPVRRSLSWRVHLKSPSGLPGASTLLRLCRRRRDGLRHAMCPVPEFELVGAQSVIRPSQGPYSRSAECTMLSGRKLFVIQTHRDADENLLLHVCQIDSRLGLAVVGPWASAKSIEILAGNSPFSETKRVSRRPSLRERSAYLEPLSPTSNAASSVSICTRFFRSSRY